MKRIISLFLILMLAAALAGCSAVQPTEAPTEPPTEPAPQLHTVAPAYDGSAEWVLVDAAMTLETADFLLADGSDFVGFAIVGSGAEAALHFRFTDEVAVMLSEQDPSLSYFITMDSVKLGDAVLNDDCSEATLITDLSADELIALADRIRGF